MTKPIEVGCLVMVIKAAPSYVDYVGHVFEVTKSPIDIGCRCGSHEVWGLSDGFCACGKCALIRIDGYDPSIDVAERSKEHA